MTIALLLLGIFLVFLTIYLSVKFGRIDALLFFIVAFPGMFAIAYTFAAANRSHYDDVRAEFLASEHSDRIASLNWSGNAFKLSAFNFFEIADRPLIACTDRGVEDGTLGISELEQLEALCIEVRARLSAAQNAQPAGDIEEITLDTRDRHYLVAHKDGQRICLVSRRDGSLRPVSGQTLAAFEAAAPLCATAASRITLAQASNGA